MLRNVHVMNPFATNPGDTMNLNQKAQHLASLHVGGKPLVLYNVWDAAGARAVAQAGAAAVATGSWSLAAAHGYDDGESIPLDFVERIVARIVAATDLPVSVDFEGGYAVEPERVAANVERLLKIGVAGINFEDRRVGGEGTYGIDEQGARIRAIVRRAQAAGVTLFVNARTDLFLQAERSTHADVLPAAIERAQAYADAGGGGFFAPGLVDEKSIAKLCAASPLPVNIMMMQGAPPVARLAALGVARVSYGPLPFIAATRALEARAREALGAAEK